MLLIVDGNHMAYRARYKYMLSNKGVDVSITYGMLHMINALLDKFPADALAICWDGGIPEHRRYAIPEYKANRHLEEDPLIHEDMVRQMQEISVILSMAGVVNLRRPGAEADDIIYHLAKMSREKTVIVTGDRDLLQAVDDNIRVYSPLRELLYSPKMVEEEYGVPLKQYVDWKALQGDSSDNIPGVTGIGEKTATKLFLEYKTLTGITNAALGINPAHKMTGKLADNITSFGLDRLAKNVYVMALYADRVGARLEIIRAEQGYFTSPSRQKFLKGYFMRNAFVSLIGCRLYGMSPKFRFPKLTSKLMRTPVVATRRMAVA